MIRQRKTSKPKRVRLAVGPGRKTIGNRYLGPSYKLNNQQHFLPPPRTLQPLVDIKAGEVELWPAHASNRDGSSASTMLSKNKRLVLVDDDELGKPDINPKPRFLKQLDAFLKKELRTLNCTEVKPSELRLQAHRQVFESLIENFRTYRSILAVIKNEYEMMITYQKQRIRELEPLQEALFTFSEQYDKQIMDFLQEEKKDISNLKKVNQQQLNELSVMANEKKDLQKQVERLQEKIQDEYLKYRDESDARKLLISEIVDLRYKPDDHLYSQMTELDINPIIRKAVRKWKQKIGY